MTTVAEHIITSLADAGVTQVWVWSATPSTR